MPLRLWHGDVDAPFSIQQFPSVDNSDAHEPSVYIEAERVTLGRLVEVHGAAGVTHMQIEHIRLPVVGDVIKDGTSDCDCHGSDLLANAVMMRPAPAL